MPFPTISLNDGAEIPVIAFGTGSKWKGHDVVDYVDQAIQAGFSHIDTAAFYANEDSVGEAIHNSGLDRSEFYITTKYDGGQVRNACLDSLSKLDLKSADLYLIHGTWLAKDGDIEALWKDFENLKAEGLVKSIGVSNYKLEDLKRTVESAKVTPAVNQIQFHPYNYSSWIPLLEYQKKHNIAFEAYGSLAPITTYPNGPVSPILSKIASRLSTKEVEATPAQVIFKWVLSKGGVVVTTSGKKERDEEYLAALDLPDLMEDEIAEIEEKGAQGPGLRYIISESIDSVTSSLRIEPLRSLTREDMRRRALLCIVASVLLLFVLSVRSGMWSHLDVSFEAWVNSVRESTVVRGPATTTTSDHGCMRADR